MVNHRCLKVDLLLLEMVVSLLIFIFKSILYLFIFFNDIFFLILVVTPSQSQATLAIRSNTYAKGDSQQRKERNGAHPDAQDLRAQGLCSDMGKGEDNEGYDESIWSASARGEDSEPRESLSKPGSLV